MSGLVGTENIIAFNDSGLNENRLFQVRKYNIYSINQPEKVYLPPLPIKLHLRIWIKISLAYVFEKILSQDKWCLLNHFNSSTNECTIILHKTLLKHFKTPRHVSILSDHHQGALFLAKVIIRYSHSILIFKRSVVAAYHVVWECVVEQWLGVRRMLSITQWLGVRRMPSITQHTTHT